MKELHKYRKKKKMKATYQIDSAKIDDLMQQCIATISYAFQNDPFGSYPLLCLEKLKGEGDIYPPPHPLCFTGSFADLAQIEKECEITLKEGETITFLTAMRGHSIEFNREGVVEIEAPCRFIQNWGGSHSYVPRAVRELEDDQCNKIESTLGCFTSFEEYYQARKKVALPCHWDWKGLGLD